MKHYMFCLFITLGLLAACNGGSNSTTYVTVLPPNPNQPTAITHINLTGITAQNDQTVNLHQVLVYTATGIKSDGSSVDLTNSNNLVWSNSANLESSNTPGTYSAINVGTANISISYKNILSQNLESSQSILIKDNSQPISVNYTHLQIGGDIQLESVESGETIKYTALGITADNHESDLTNATSWQILEPNAPLIQIDKGIFVVESGMGTFTINATYTNKNQSIIESSYQVKVVNDKLKLSSIHIYPESEITLSALTNTKANFKLEGKGFDHNNNAYTLDPQLITWSINPITAASIEESTGYLQINSATTGNLTVTASYNNLTSNSVLVSVKRITSAITTTNDGSKFTAIRNDQIFYVSSESIVKSCPVATVATINKDSLGIDDLNHIANESECTSYQLPQVSSIRNRRLYYNSRYKQIYTVGDNLLNNILYSINATNGHLESYALPESMSDISYDSNESNIYLLHTQSNQTSYTNSIYYCPLTIDGPQNSACKLLTQQESALNPQFKLVTSYIFYYNIADIEHLYIFDIFYDNQLKINHLKILHISASGDSTTVFDSGDSSSPYYAYDIEMTKPAILTNQSNTYVYSIGLKPIAQLNNDLEPNTLQIKSNGNIVINYESTLNVLGTKSNYENPATINTYSNLAFDSQNKWAFYGTKVNQDHLSKCSYARMGTKGEILGDCKDVTNFADTYAGLTFVPGQSVYQKNTSALDNLFFIAKALSTTGSFTNTVVAQCSSKNNGGLINEKDCIKYKIPYMSNNGTLTKNKFYNRIYVTNLTTIIYVINPDTYQIKDYTPILQTHITKLVFSLDNTRVYILNESASGTYLHTCQVAEDGAITSICSRIMLAKTTNSKRDMVNFNDKYLYISLSNSNFKCNISTSGDISKCSSIALINPIDKIDYNSKKLFYQFSEIYQANGIKPFIYLTGKISNQYLVWPAVININTGELTLNGATPATNSDPHIINGGDNLRVDHLSFKDTVSKAYVASSSVTKILICPYDNDIADFGTINLHGNTISCSNLADFNLYQTLNLIYMANN